MRYSLIVTCMILTGMYCTKSFADVSYADLFLDRRGYKPVEDTWLDKSFAARFTREKGFPDNQLYKEWCINTFKNGEQIYEAYKEIAFYIDYRAEALKTDYWQTPFETRQSRQGDCEDSVFLFFSKLSELDIDGDIIWGWVVDGSSSITFAHVWYQLFDKRGSPYIVEGFSKDWNGIIPLETITGLEERVPTLMLSHGQVNHVVDEMIPIPDYGHGQEAAESSEDAQFRWSAYFSNTSTIKEIFHKLHDMFIRYREQMHNYCLSGAKESLSR